MPVVITADFIWAEGETHFAAHRYTVSAYLFDESSGKYTRQLKYVTSRKYPGIDNADAVNALRPERNTILQKLTSSPNQ